MTDSTTSGGGLAEEDEVGEAEYQDEVADRAFRREVRRRAAVNERLAARGHRPAVVPRRPDRADAVRYLAEALRRGNDLLEAELRADERGHGGDRGLGHAARGAHEADRDRPPQT